MKINVNYTIESDVIKNLDLYLKDRKRILGGKPSKSSIVEEAISKHLVLLRKELKDLTPSSRDASIVH